MIRARPTLHPLPVLLLLLPALSGCLGVDDAGAGTPEVPDAAGDAGGVGAEPPTSEAGTVLGVVLDEVLRPVAGATVTAVPAGGSDAAPPAATADENGAFLLVLPPGEHALRLEADGFEPHAETVTVHAGQRTDLDVALDRLPPPPLVEVQSFQGFIQCDVIVQPTHQHGNGHQHNNQRCDEALLEADRHVWDLPVRPSPDGIVVEVAWEPNHELARFLYVRVEAEDGTLLADHEAPGPLRIHVARGQLYQHVEGGGTLRVVAIVGTGEHSGGNDLGVAVQFQQEFEAFASVFYGQRPPPDYFLLR